MAKGTMTEARVDVGMREMSPSHTEILQGQSAGFAKTYQNLFV